MISFEMGNGIPVKLLTGTVFFNKKHKKSQFFILRLWYKGVMILPVIILAVVIDLCLGEPPSSVHPTVWMGKQIGFLKKLSSKLNPRRLKAADFIWGILIVLSGIALWGTILFIFEEIFENRPWFLLLLSAPLLKVSFSLRYLIFSAAEIRNALNEGDLDRARTQTAWHLVSRNTRELDEKEISSCVIESLSENITDSFSSPLFYFLIAGLPGAWCYRFINTSDAMIAYRTETLEWLGKFTAWCDSLLNLIPARLTGIMICVGAFITPGVSGKQAWRIMIRDRGNTESPNAGWTMAAMAGALSCRLEKRDCYVLGAGMELPVPDRIDLCLRLTICTLLLTLAGLILFYGGARWVLNTVV